MRFIFIFMALLFIGCDEYTDIPHVENQQLIVESKGGLDTSSPSRASDTPCYFTLRHVPDDKNYIRYFPKDCKSLKVGQKMIIIPEPEETK